MSRSVVSAALFLLVGTGALAGCGASGKTADLASAPAPAPVSITPVAAVEQPVARFIRASGSLTAEDHADVAAEVAGRVVATPIERGTAVSEGTPLVRISPAETDAQAREAEANAGQIEARLGITAASPLDVNAVPEVRTAVASFNLATEEFKRVQSLLDQKVVSQSEFDQRRTQLEAARLQVDSAKNAALQQYQALQAARARVALAQKALADTTVRAPFSGLVAERLVSAGDYVTKGMKVAVVVRVNPLRVQLTVPEQFVSAIGARQTVTLEVDAYPGRVFEGHVLYVSPALEANQRALLVEASVPNPGYELKPGMFATARIEQPVKASAVVVPAAAVRVGNGTSRVFVAVGDHVEERIVTVGQTLEGMVEITAGLKPGEKVATTNVGQLGDGMKVS